MDRPSKQFNPTSLDLEAYQYPSCVTWRLFAHLVFGASRVYDLFGEWSSRKMHRMFFGRHLRLDDSSAIKADTSKQNFTVLPRDWYVDATFLCRRCRKEFLFSATEQKLWYEEYTFYVWSLPSECGACRHELRWLKSLRQSYDREIGKVLRCKDVELKVHVAAIIDQLISAGEVLPAKIHENRRLLERQIARAARAR